MNLKFFYNKIKKELPGNKYEKGAMIDIMKYQFYSFFIGVFFLLLSFYFNEKFIYALVFIYPIMPVGTYAIPIVLQEPNQPNRFNALSSVALAYFILFIIVLIVALITIWIDYKITLISFVIFYIMSIYGLINQIKKSIS
tara:strand:- start:2713 stop:3132 length:420 start_codon:yes stop_codon:yes gene_type:complete